MLGQQITVIKQERFATRQNLCECHEEVSINESKSNIIQDVKVGPRRRPWKLRKCELS